MSRVIPPPLRLYFIPKGLKRKFTDFEVFFGGFSLFPPLPLHGPSAYLAIKDHIVAWSDCEVEHLC